MKKIVLLAVAMLGIVSCGNAQVQQTAPTKVEKVNKQENKKVMKPIELNKAEFLKRTTKRILLSGNILATNLPSLTFMPHGADRASVFLRCWKNFRLNMVTRLSSTK